MPAPAAPAAWCCALSSEEQPSPPLLLLLLYSSLSLFQFFFFFLLSSGPPPGPRSAAAGRRRSRAALGAGGPGARGAPGAAHGARGRTGRGRERRAGTGEPPARPPACLLSLAFRLSPRRAGGRELPGLSLKRGVLHRSSRRKPALRSPPLHSFQYVTFFSHCRRTPKSQVLVKKSQRWSWTERARAVRATAPHSSGSGAHSPPAPSKRL